MSVEHGQNRLGTTLIGRSFVHPAFDYMLIGGGLSLVVAAIVWIMASPDDAFLVNAALLPFFILLSNSAHFAASTVRLYTKPDSLKMLPFLTMAFPLIAIALLTLCLFQAGRWGPFLQALYLTWSPFHYAAQAYGLAVMYGFRSGCQLNPNDKRLLWWVCQIPFFHTFIYGLEGGLRWLVSRETLDSLVVINWLDQHHSAITVVAFLVPLILFVKVWRSSSGPLPLISMLAVVSNSIWWFVLTPLNAFVYATIFHGIQYLAIVIIFHVKDQMSRPDNKHRVVYHVACFYGMSLLLGYGLFQCLPFAYVFAGFGLLESALLVTATINIHHFIVDAYIWRLKQGDSNRRVVETSLSAPI